ncbi:argininosuccinate synthase [Haloarcula marismortui ATCC 43049]|uniref:Argininosuccinate synthase n=2 Tax=Haloarcula marismortui (strain ATCC 43049 / DSM 3752 / JCM 8966 / VKM B-1809) TaxID=272569 RepID=ASSY_HALMA|nr:argininosuccinate synthase [Haloarcula marismortui]Q5UZ46.1 RecName: Full=Argininosuccinate synthase; AltName: Full=Citrulline--aspartate ligase [Haloarcula marismortui ATCC 43049]AAV47457.1 argininosuccinate synthase [Haloarcula marismortui ATCC 43049]QCP92161.1 argininosuccinate synthase [Haloarcula marismortui ATCC 43049]
MPEGNGTVALAFSGGLDTTVCVSLLKEEYGYDEVIGVTVDVGQPDYEFEEAEETAEALGVEQHVVDATEEFADLCMEAVKANADYQGYPLGTALARPVIAKAILSVAEDEGCSAVAHGCTGKGNDQLRFESVWRDSDLDVIAPVRELGLTREWENEYAAEKGLPVEGGDGGRYSIDTNLWSRSIEGSELEDPSTIPADDIYKWTDNPSDKDAELVEVEFEDGVPVAVDGEELGGVELIEQLNKQAGAHGIGRTDMMEDRMLGLKVRENYEHPAATVLLTAHEALEGLVLTQEERQFKAQVDQEWSQKAYQGLVDAPLTGALEAFIDDTNERVTGTVTVKLEGGHCRPVSRESDYAVYSESAASFNEEDVSGGITQQDATGVAKYHGFQSRLANKILDDAKKGAAVTDGSGDHAASEDTEE